MNTSNRSVILVELFGKRNLIIQDLAPTMPVDIQKMGKKQLH